MPGKVNIGGSGCSGGRDPSGRCAVWLSLLKLLLTERVLVVWRKLGLGLIASLVCDYMFNLTFMSDIL